MPNRIAKITPQQAARIAGAGYLVIIIAAIFAEFFVRTKLVVPGNAATTVSNLQEHEMQFRMGIIGYLVAAVFDVIVALALYVMLKPVNQSLSLLAAWFRLIHATLLAFALYHLLNVLLLLSAADYLSVLTAGQLQANVMLSLNAFNDVWLIGLVFFGLHCLVLGYLIFKSAYLPRLLGILLIIAAVGYIIDSFAHFLLPNYADYETVFLLMVAVPAIVAEFSLTFWLLFREIRVQPER